MNEWISVEDRLPEKNQRVWVWYKGSATHSGAAWKREGMSIAVWWGTDAKVHRDGWNYISVNRAMKEFGMDECRITHWMSLPEPPK